MSIYYAIYVNPQEIAVTKLEARDTVDAIEKAERNDAVSVVLTEEQMNGLIMAVPTLKMDEYRVIE